MTAQPKPPFTLVKIESTNNSYPKGADRADCAGSTCTYAEEIQNFANWYTYYRTRALTAIGGTAEAFAAVPEEYRVGYGRINKTGATSIDGKNFATLERGVRGFSAANKNQFYTWLSGRTQPSGSTPLRRAMDDVGQYFSWNDNRGPCGTKTRVEPAPPPATSMVPAAQPSPAPAARATPTARSLHTRTTTAAPWPMWRCTTGRTTCARTWTTPSSPS